MFALLRKPVTYLILGGIAIAGAVVIAVQIVGVSAPTPTSTPEVTPDRVVRFIRSILPVSEKFAALTARVDKALTQLAAEENKPFPDDPDISQIEAIEPGTSKVTFLGNMTTEEIRNALQNTPEPRIPDSLKVALQFAVDELSEVEREIGRLISELQVARVPDSADQWFEALVTYYTNVKSWYEQLRLNRERVILTGIADQDEIQEEMWRQLHMENAFLGLRLEAHILTESVGARMDIPEANLAPDHSVSRPDSVGRLGILATP